MDHSSTKSKVVSEESGSTDYIVAEILQNAKSRESRQDIVRNRKPLSPAR